ncbi:MAG: hypothetical protein HYZ75_17820 [Elusimicrobia bacterium]|nr:hypothetical protein [Elusimicrobiota bacterium]
MTALSLLLALCAASAAANPPAAPAAAPAVAASTKSLSVEEIYGAARLRDPFMKLMGAGIVAPTKAIKEYDPEEFSIHTLELKGVLRDKSGPMALLIDPGTNMSFILRGGKLFDGKRKPVPGVTGSVKIGQKTVTLMTADKDVQTLRLGESASEAEE